MRFKEWDDYLDSMLRHVQFSPDRHRIRTEFEEHMNDMFDDYISDGISEDEAKTAVLDNIGDSTEVGRLMNKAHNAVISWIWQVLKMCLIVTVVLCLNPITGPLLGVITKTVISIPDIITGYDDSTIHGETIWTVDIGERVILDDHKLIFDELVKKQDGTLELRYRDITSPLNDSFHFDITADMIFNEEGPVMVDGLGGSSNGGYIDYVQREITGFPADSRLLIIEFKGDEMMYKGRHFRIEVELPDQ